MDFILGIVTIWHRYLQKRLPIRHRRLGIGIITKVENLRGPIPPILRQNEAGVGAGAKEEAVIRMLLTANILTTAGERARSKRRMRNEASRG